MKRPSITVSEEIILGIKVSGLCFFRYRCTQKDEIGFQNALFFKPRFFFVFNSEELEPSIRDWGWED